jgi:indolepyruvate ferredoxin oxidoreductase alpha subunit
MFFYPAYNVRQKGDILFDKRAGHCMMYTKYRIRFCQQNFFHKAIYSNCAFSYFITSWGRVMKKNKIEELCRAEAGRTEVLQGNIAFAVGCVRAGIHSAEGYPGTPSTEVIDRGLSQVQDMITVGWSVNEAVAVGAGLGQTLAGRDTVVTMKIPGLFQAGDVFTSSSYFYNPRGALIYYIASDFTPSSTQHLVDPRSLFKGCSLPVFEPSNHQEMYDAPAIAVEVGRKYQTPVVILASGTLCHSEGLIRLAETQTRPPQEMDSSLRSFNLLPGMARNNYDTVRTTRIPALREMAEASPLNKWVKGSGKRGVIVSGANTIFANEVKTVFDKEIDILSLGFTNPLPEKLINDFCSTISGDIYVFEDGSTYLQDEIKLMGYTVKGKQDAPTITEYSPALVAQKLGHEIQEEKSVCDPVMRPPMICAGCPYILFANVIAKMKERGTLLHAFGDIGCNALLYFLDAMDTGVAMGASESKRAGYVLANPEMAGKCISILGDSTECHSGMDATRNTVFRKVPGVKVVLDNYWTAMTGGQPAPTSPVNLAGEPNTFDLVEAIRSNGAKTILVDSYDVKSLRKVMRQALKDAEDGEFTTVVVRGGCMKKVPARDKGVRLKINKEKCQQCDFCLICAGNEKGEDGFPLYNNLCSGCGTNTPACMQMCPHGAIEFLEEGDQEVTAAPEFPTPEEIGEVSVDKASLPEKLSLAIRGIGGQGNLFFGRVLTQLAFLAGYDKDNIVKGETHGMAQMGGPVISTFSCGDVHSPVLLPGEADCLVAMEMSEVLRPGFLGLLKEGGTLVCATTTVVPQALAKEDYPTKGKIYDALGGTNVVEVDVLGKALELGDSTGRIANVVMMGVLSKIAPLDVMPVELWLKALEAVTPHPKLWAANYAAFYGGRELI